jgi:oxygen-independent coproporphyrinogen-3 oxidase
MGLYIHVPYCEAKCHYCDFNSYAGREREFEAMAQAIHDDLERATRTRVLPALTTIFVGGGTPSVMPGAAVARWLGLARERLGFAPDVEITSEANPGSLNAEWLEAMQAAGLTRLSMGVQSLDDDELRTLGRVHTRAVAREAVAIARRAGVRSLSLDLIFGLPGQSLDRWKRNLDEILALDADHLSLYGLIIEEGTPFGRLHAQGRLEVPDDDVQAEMYECARAAMAAHGYEQYEISNFARPGHRCRHNEMYWRNGEYLGVGPGAVSYLGGWRFTRVPRPSEYVRRVQRGEELVTEAERLSSAAALAESAILGLRTIEGVHLGALAGRFDVSPGLLREAVSELLADLVEGAGVRLDPDRLSLDEGALMVSNVAMERLLALSDDLTKRGAFVTLSTVAV